MDDAILVLNAGSSSIKFSLFAESGTELALVTGGQVESIYTSPRFVAKDAAGKPAGEKRWEAGAKVGHDGALAHVLDWLKAAHGAAYRLAAIGHRVVHGGTEYAAPVRVDAAVVAKLEKLVPLAPLHQPHNLAPVRMLLGRRPDLPQVACFDTAFHATNPDVARRFAIPAELHDAGVRRYGFHGLSYEYIASALPGLDARAAEGKVDRVSSRQRLEHVRAGGRAQRGEHDGLHRGRRPADGHPQRQHRSGRAALPHGRARHGRARHREAALQPVGPPGRVGHLERHEEAAGNG